MIVMPTDNSGFECGRLFGMFPDKMGHLHNPEYPKGPKHVYWAVDNGVFGAWKGKREWSEEHIYSYLERFAVYKPAWVAVPDAVGDRSLTLERWATHSNAIKNFGVPLAFVVQDGMTPADVPEEAEVVFVGGGTAFKWETLCTWVDNFPRVHVGRVNTERHLWMAHEAGAESCDGTGWFRGGSGPNNKQLMGLIRYLEQSSAGGQLQLNLLDEGK